MSAQNLVELATWLKLVVSNVLKIWTPTHLSMQIKALKYFKNRS